MLEKWTIIQCNILTPRIRDSYRCCYSVTNKTGLHTIQSLMRRSHGLSARRVRRTKSRGAKGLQLEVGAQRAPWLLVSYISKQGEIVVVSARVMVSRDQLSTPSDLNSLSRLLKRKLPCDQSHLFVFFFSFAFKVWLGRAGFPYLV